MEKKIFKYRKIYAAYISTIIVSVLHIAVFLILIKVNSIIGCLITLLLIWQSDNILWIVNKIPLIEKKGSFSEENGILIISYGDKIFRADHVTGLFLSKRKFWAEGTKLRIECGSESVEFLSAYLRRSGAVEETDLYYIFEELFLKNPSLLQVKDSEGRPVKYSYKNV